MHFGGVVKDNADEPLIYIEFSIYLGVRLKAKELNLKTNTQRRQ